jgi:transcriptional regulator with XRE-family HTH domain
LDQSDLADMAGVSLSQIERFETGAQRISASMLFAFAQHLSAPLEAFYDGLPGSRPAAAAMCGRVWAVERPAATPRPMRPVFERPRRMVTTAR